ncbi:MAG: hypothetical protein ACRYGM_19805 [Janthinobacterium lividum]
MADALAPAGASAQAGPLAATPAAPPVASPAATKAEAGGGFSFHELLSELNPLQYLPVIGTIYRSVTGDTIPESARIAGSLVVSGLTGGPIGLALNVAFLGLQKATGIDPEAMGSTMLASLGLGSGSGSGSGSGAGPVTDPGAAPASAPGPDGTMLADAAGGATAWSASQLAAYGVRQGADGGLSRSGVSGSDVLNDLVLAGLRPGLQLPGTSALA